MADATLDASLLISLGAISALEIAWDNGRYRWHITPIVRGEVIREPTRSEISNAILSGRLLTAELDTTSAAELAAFSHWTRIVDPGEAEAIAVAIVRGWVVGLEDLFAQRQLAAAGVGWVNTARLLLDAVDDSRVSAAEGDRLFKALDCYPGYTRRGCLTLSDLR